MTDKERIAALEQELEQLRNRIAQAEMIHQNIAGENQAFQAAVFALVASMPPQQLCQALRHHLLTTESGIVAMASVEARLEGFQGAQSALLEISSCHPEAPPATYRQK